MTLLLEELQAVEANPEYRRLLRIILKFQLLNLCEKLSTVGEESCILTASRDDGNVSHFGSSRGEAFLTTHDTMIWNFQSFCGFAEGSQTSGDVHSPEVSEECQATSVDWGQHQISKDVSCGQQRKPSNKHLTKDMISHRKKDFIQNVQQELGWVISEDQLEQQDLKDDDSNAVIIKCEPEENGTETSVSSLFQTERIQRVCDVSMQNSPPISKRNVNTNFRRKKKSSGTSMDYDDHDMHEYYTVDESFDSAGYEGNYKGEGEVCFNIQDSTNIEVQEDEDYSSEQTDPSLVVILQQQELQQQMPRTMKYDNAWHAWCPVCNKCFVNSSEMSIHLRSHTGDRPYQCPICQKTFTQSGTLTRHLDIHIGTKLYTCVICQKTFNRLHHLKRHNITRHKNMMNL